MKKVLIVSYYFPPLNIMAAKRYGTMCRYFEKYGYEAYVLTTAIKECSYLGAKRDLENPISKRTIRIRRKKQLNRLETKGLFQFITFLDKWKICCRAVMNYDELLWYENIKEKIDLEKLKDIDLIIGTYGPIGSIYIAKYLAKKLNCPYIVDIRDLISEWKETAAGYRRGYRIDQAIEKRLLSSASGLVAITHGFKTILQKKYPSQRIVTVYNGWDGKKRKNLNDSGEKYLYYAGSLYEHRLESLHLLLRALKRINEKKNIKLMIRSVGPKMLDDKVSKMISDMGMDDYVKLLSSITSDIINEEQDKAFINIILSSVHENNIDQMVTVPGKTYELMNEKAPVLAITSKRSEVAKLLAYTNKGVAATEEDEIIEFILYDNNQYTGNEHVAKFSREYQAKMLCRFMDEILEKKQKR